MLEANPNLTWRDVKHILASSADKIDVNRTTSYNGITQYDWVTNAAGYNFHNWYGFGKIDATRSYLHGRKLLNKLENLLSLAAIKTQMEPEAIIYGVNTDAIAYTAPAGSNNSIEFVRVIIKMDHAIPNSWVSD